MIDTVNLNQKSSVSLNRIVFGSLIFMSLLACNNQDFVENDALPIIMGDSSTIVTETDSQYLKNDIEDYVVDDNNPKSDLDTTNKGDSNITKSDIVNEQKGFKINIDDIFVILNDVSDKNITSKNGYYVIKQSHLPKIISVFPDLKDPKYQYRYVSEIDAKTRYGTLDLNNAGLYTSEWHNLKWQTENNIQKINMPTLDDIIFQNFRQSKLQDIIKKGINDSKFKSAEKKKIASELKSISSIKDKRIVISPVKLELRISGKNNGKSIQKNIELVL